MRTWKIHFCWALVAMGSAGAWGRWTASQHETVIREREAAGGVRDPHPAQRSTPSAPAAPEAASPVPDAPLVRLPAGVHLLPDPWELPLDEIRQLMKSPDFREVYKALAAIQHLKDHSLRVELIREVLKSGHAQIRRSAMHSLVRELGDEAVPEVQELLRSDPEHWIRAEAAEMLGTLANRGSVELLMTAYRDGDSDLKIAAAASLYKFGHPGEATESIAQLTANLDNPDGAVRRETVEQIGKLRAPIAIPLLARALRDVNGDVRSEAAMALGDIDSPEIIPLLEPLLKDPFADVRESAKDAIENQQARTPK